MTNNRLSGVLAIAALSLGLVQPTLAEDPSNRVNVAIGGTTYSGEVAGFLALDYTYKFGNNITTALFVEKASGDFDIEAIGVTVGYAFDSGYKFAVGPGLERKLKDKTLDLWHVSAGYDWQVNNWTVGPTVSYDFIEDNSNVLYVGLAVGYGF